VNFVSPNHVYFLKGTIDMDLAVIKARRSASVVGTYRNGYMPIFLIISMSWMQEKNTEYKTYRISQRDLSYWAHGVLVEVR